MAIQNSAVESVFPFKLQGLDFSLDNETIAQDVARTIALAQFTIMAQIASSQKWVPWSSLVATDGTAFPVGYLKTDGGFTAAQIAAGDVTGASIVVGGMGLEIDGTQIIFDTGVGGGNVALSLTSVLSSNAAGTGAATPYLTMSAKRWLEARGIFVRSTVALDKTEN